MEDKPRWRLHRSPFIAIGSPGLGERASRFEGDTHSSPGYRPMYGMHTLAFVIIWYEVALSR